MGLLDIFRKKKVIQKVDSKELIEAKQSLAVATPQKKKKVRNLVDFIEDSLTSNGGNYDDIYQKLLAISIFAKSAKEYGVTCSLGRIDETLTDFFTKQDDIKFYPFKNIPYRAFYTKKDGWNRYNYRGVTVIKDAQAQKPVLYYGRRNEKAETHRKDVFLCFDDDAVILRDESLARYDEIPLYGDGTHAEFYFDEQNHITSVKFRYMTHPRLGFWSREQICEFDRETNQYKLLPSQVPKVTYNDPKPSEASMRILANDIINSGYRPKPSKEESAKE